MKETKTRRVDEKELEKISGGCGRYDVLSPELDRPDATIKDDESSEADSEDSASS